MAGEALPAGGGDLRLARIGVGLVLASAGFVGIWVAGDAQASPAETLAAWTAAVALVVAALVALAFKGRHAGWFHPLSLPFAAVTVMALGAPLWVSFTHQATGLLYDPGYVSAGTPSLAVAVSVTASEALTLVLAGYLAGAGTALALSRAVTPTAVGQRRPMFRYEDMRRAGLMLMAGGAASQLVVVVLRKGATYGANQTTYGLPTILGSGAATALMAGLIIVTLATSHTARPRSLRNLLRGSEWAALSLYYLAGALGGGRAGLIAPAVYLAWVYSTQVRVVAFRWIVAGVLLALIGGTVISNYRQNDTLLPRSPAAILQNAAGGASSSAWLTQQTVLYVPSAEGFLHGSTYLAAAEGQLPGPLSQVVGAPTRTASAVFRDLIGFSSPNQGFAESLPSEAYLNFGLAGCLGAGLFLGALMGWAWRKCRETAIGPRDLLYPLLIAGLVYGFRSDALTQIKEVLYPMLTMWVMLRWYRVRETAALSRPEPTA